MKDKNVRNSGMGFISVLTLMFVVLKLTNNISWSWIWVLSPIWISLILIVLVFGIILVIGRLKKGKW
ncbi:MAG TPA: hypothetical protein IAB35_03550 [Candidatus Faecimonas gallistercoris]|jgi:hypothetical protein|nr:hypothetical protein [Candidatus Faecimonas gallistercoris]